MFAHLLAPTFMVVFALVGAASAGAAEALPAAVKLSAKQSAALGVESRAIQRAGNASSGALPATVVVPNAQLRVIAAPVAALVEQVLVAPGDNVRRGQVLARLGGASLLELQRDVRQASSQEALSRLQKQRDEALFREGIIAEGRLQSSSAAHAQQAALLHERQAVLQLAGGSDKSAGAAIVAPLDGVVLEQMVAVGQRVDAAAPLFKVGKLSPLWLEMQAPAALAEGLKLGAAVTLSKGRVSGKLIQIGKQVGAGQTLTLRARIDSGAESLRPGQLVEASVDSAAQAPGSQEPALWRLPGLAVVRIQEASYVFVASADGYQARPVKVRGTSGSEVLLAGDFKDGELVAIKGVSSLKAAAMGIGGEGKAD